MGIGKPLESIGVLEAIAHGSIFLNPKFSGEDQDYLQKVGKPTDRKVRIL